jgi:hypothetical protein
MTAGIDMPDKTRREFLGAASAARGRFLCAYMEHLGDRISGQRE